MKAKWLALLTLGFMTMETKAQFSSLPSVPHYDAWNFGNVLPIWVQGSCAYVWYDPFVGPVVSYTNAINLPGLSADVQAIAESVVASSVPQVQGGVTAASGLITQTITLTTPMPDNTYSVSAHSTVSTLNLLPTTKTTTNFTLTLPLGLGGNINWILVDY